jgi:hypothetical protein
MSGALPGSVHDKTEQIRLAEGRQPGSCPVTRPRRKRQPMPSSSPGASCASFAAVSGIVVYPRPSRGNRMPTVNDVGERCAGEPRQVRQQPSTNAHVRCRTLGVRPTAHLIRLSNMPIHRPASTLASGREMIIYQSSQSGMIGWWPPSFQYRHAIRSRARARD